MTPLLVGIVVAWLACAGFSSFIARSKNRDSGGWFLLGLLFGIFALIAIAAVPALAIVEAPAPPPLTEAEVKEQVRMARRDSLISRVFLVSLVIIILFVAWLVATKRL